MMFVAYIIVVVSFAAYAVFDAVSVQARVAGAIAEKNATGASFEKIVNTFKRTSIFIYPPVLGYMIIRNEYIYLNISVLSALSFGFVVALLCLVLREFVTTYFVGVIERFEGGLSAIAALRPRKISSQKLIEIKKNFSKNSISKLKWRIVLSATWVYLVYSSSIFLLNYIAILFSEYDVVILQMLGLINGVGTIMLAFIVDPMVARYLDSKVDLDIVGCSIIVSQMLAYCVAIPMLMAVAFWVT